jgi:hypothetical protein
MKQNPLDAQEKENDDADLWDSMRLVWWLAFAILVFTAAAVSALVAGSLDTFSFKKMFWLVSAGVCCGLATCCAIKALEIWENSK